MRSAVPTQLAPLTADHAPLWDKTTFTPDAWTYTLSREEIIEVIDALTVAQDRLRGRDLATDRHITTDDFPLGRLAEQLRAMAADVADGRGFAVLRGLPVTRLTERQNAVVLRGLAAHLGTAATQSRTGQLIRDVRATGQRLGDATVRGHQTTDRLYFHTDGADAAVLLCRTAAAQGGLSRIASAGTVHNLMLRCSPQWTAELYHPFHFHMAGGNVPGLPPTFVSPVFSVHRGRFSTRYVPHTLRETPQVTGVPLTAAAIAAFDLLEELADETSIDMELQPGDLQVVNNHVVLHSRTAYTDPPLPADPRHLLRAWITFPHYNGRREAAVDEYLRFGWLTDEQQAELAATWPDPAADPLTHR
ncbi:TauD/TfdA family dioxygenase [Streptacidiphilus sp. EB103A]|uniref:TauD/TfdA family dioxygenase n=1 Tax=Streptacidiphilus sp. EB103A TaxID=3156275 RepID=UPI003515EF2C